MTLESAPVFTAQALPTPTDTARQTPSRDLRRSSSTPSIPKDSGSQYGKRGNAHDHAIGEEDVSPLDPRRFTPTLHASLVSQILTLQREVENKNKTLHNLEDFLHITKAEKDQLNHSLKEQIKENRFTKKQMQLLESSTATALGDVAKERDEAHESLADTRKRLETSKGRVRTQEEEADNARILWDKERQSWEMEKRNMETKVHLVEGRLKAVLAEIAAAQASGYDYTSASTELDDSVYRTWYTKGSDSTPSKSNSVRRQSRMSGQSDDTNEVSEYLNYRASTLSGLNGLGINKRNGISLADELDFGADEPDQDEGMDEVMTPDALPEEAHFRRRRPSVQTPLQDLKAWKLLGLLPKSVEQTIKDEGLTEKAAVAFGDNHTVIEKPSVEDEKTRSPQKASAAQCVESATQSSPTSPKLPPELDNVPSEKLTEKASTMEHTANQSRKRISIPLPMEQTAPMSPVPQMGPPMVSAGCQTINQPPSPPLTPIIKIEPLAPASLHADKEVGMVSSSMQTDDQEQTVPPAASTRQEPSSMMIPVIEIHPPGSRPASCHTSVVLPPRTKNASCQASITLPVSLRSVSVQTEAIIPARQPSNSASKPLAKSASHPPLPVAGLGKIEEHSHEPPQPALRKSSRKQPHRASESSRPRIRASVSVPVVDTYPANNHSRSSTSKQSTGLRRPVRDGSLFAGFDSSFTNKSLNFEDLDLSGDDDFATVAPIRKTLSKVQNSWKLIPHSEAGRLESEEISVEALDMDECADPWLASLVPFDNQEPVIPKTRSQNASTKPPVPSKAGGKTAMNQATTLTKAPEIGMPRRRSPSAPCLPEKHSSTVAPPPFPVPTRSSSRRVPISASEGAQSPTPYSTTFFSTARKREAGNPSLRNSLRKVQSAAAVTRRGRSSEQTKKPTQSTPSPRLASGSPQLLKMSKNCATHQPRHVQQTTHALPATSLSGEVLIDTPGQSITVVDAIAQTMVGEWMWKYVRRRKSFGVTDNVDFDENGNGDGNGIRHKRWVWLAPYERAVMWSNKQPTSGAALMGQSGRKLNIQSVLDVKDDTPMPKNSNPQTYFARSILILTPQRALKFTATARDRHYVWLNALSFLSHSSLGMDDLTTIPPVPQAEYPRPPSQRAGGGLRRSSIRDSIRVAKSKERPTTGGRAYSSPITTLPQASLEDIRMPALPDDTGSDAAEAPSIPRTAAQTRTHARKRSSSGPRPLPLNIRPGFPVGIGALNSARSLKTPSIANERSALAARGQPSQPTHDPMSPLDPIRNNFFDAVGTARMEAFVERGGEKGVVKKHPPPSSLRNNWARKTGKKDLRYWGVGGEKAPSSTGLEDPFSSRF